MIELRALAALLSYPRPDVLAALPEIRETLMATPHLPARDRQALGDLIGEIAAAGPLEAEERYVETFDRGRSASLNLFEHLHGDSRDRGAAMVELRQMYERAGFSQATNELPDHLPVLLEYLSCREPTEIRETLTDCADILRSIGEALLKRQSRYAAALQAVLILGRAAPLDPVRAARRPKERLNPDRDWAERPAFDPDPATLAARRAP